MCFWHTTHACCDLRVVEARLNHIKRNPITCREQSETFCRNVRQQRKLTNQITARGNNFCTKYNNTPARVISIEQYWY